MYNTYSFRGMGWFNHIPVFTLLFLVFSISILSIPNVSGASTPSFVVTVSEESITVWWEVQYVLSEAGGFVDKKVTEFQEAYENNYSGKMEEQLELFLSKEFSDHTGRECVVSDLELELRGDGSDWTDWMRVSVQFTVRGLHYKQDNGTAVDFSFLKMKLRHQVKAVVDGEEQWVDLKGKFEDKHDPDVTYSFYPKYLLGMNWKDTWGGWELTARDSQEAEGYLYVRLPARRRFRPFEEYDDISVKNEKPVLEVRIPKNGIFHNDYVYLPAPPTPPDPTEETKRLLVYVGIGTIVLILIAAVIVLYYRRGAKERRIRKLEEKSEKERQRSFRDRLRQEFGKIDLFFKKRGKGEEKFTLSSRLQRLMGRTPEKEMTRTERLYRWLEGLLERFT